MMARNPGFTLPEVLIALVVIMLAITALALTQVNNLRASVSASLATETKAAANVVLEEVMASVLAVPANPTSVEDYTFFHYYWSCPSVQNPPVGTPSLGTNTCNGTRAIGNVNVTFVVSGETGILGEGVLTVTVTGVHTQRQQTLTIGDRITCYDVYPSPSSTAPEPCPVPTQTGGGRT